MVDIQLSGTKNFHFRKIESVLRAGAEEKMIAFFVLASLAFHQGISKGTVTVEKRFDSFIYFFCGKLDV